MTAIGWPANRWQRRLRLRKQDAFFAVVPTAGGQANSETDCH